MRLRPSPDQHLENGKEKTKEKELKFGSGGGKKAKKKKDLFTREKEFGILSATNSRLKKGKRIVVFSFLPELPQYFSFLFPRLFAFKRGEREREGNKPPP